MITVSKQDELVPVVPSGTELHESVKGFGFAGSLHAHRVASQEIGPVLLRRIDQNIGRREGYVVGGKVGEQRREEAYIPEFTCFPPIAGGDVADILPVGDQFPQPNKILLPALR